ncbi:hypothetical protein HMPREF0484_3414 [Klebsiella pneumoniae subsp. rhinoscleromatis ATCC 13884]|nr:hypothetical protein HMPREF0484_3414 [Klebsiella pneumoniae subsp. rhinoscleromatis ATCC 13884]
MMATQKQQEADQSDKGTSVHKVLPTPEKAAIKRHSDNKEGMDRQGEQ